MAIENISTLSWILIGVAVAIWFLTIFRVKKGKKVLNFKRNTFAGFFLIVGIVLFVIQAGFLAGMGIGPFAIGGGAPLAAGEGTGQVQVSGEVCPPGSVEDVTVTLAATDYDTGAATGGTHAYRLISDGVESPTRTVSDAGTFTAAAGDTVKVLWYNASLGSGYFSDVSTHQLSCSKGAETLTNQLHDNGSVTIEVFNEEGNLVDGYTAGACTENETVANGDVVTLPIKFKQAYETSMPFGSIIVVEYNTSCLDDVIIDLGGSEVSVPGFIEKNDSALGAYAKKAYSVPATFSSDILQGSITIDVDDTQDPQLEADVGYAQILLFTAAPNYYFDQDAGGAFAGPSVEDEDDVQTIGFLDNYSICLD